MLFEGRRFVARVTTATMRSAALALAIWAGSTVIAGALPGAAEPDTDAATNSTAPNLPGGDIATTDPSEIPTIAWKMANDVAVWKTLDLGGYASVNMLLE